jgi:nucleoside-diphosphate-sugar epimerase
MASHDLHARQPMKALVTGASGFIGSRLCSRLAEQGHVVRALVRRTSRRESLRQLDVELVEGDVLDRSSLEQATDGIDTVFHFAAVFRKEVPRRQIWATNVDGIDNLLSASMSSGVRQFLHCSSTSVYGLSPQPPTTEKSPFVPIPEDLYQESKLEAENRVRSYARSGRMSTTIVRTTGVYGPGDLRFLKLFKPIAHRRFAMIGPGKVLFSMIHIDDLLDGVMRCASQPIAMNNHYLLTGDNPISLNETAATIARAAGVPPPRWHIPVMPVYYMGYLMESILRPLNIRPPLFRRRVNFFRITRGFDNSKAKQELGFRPAVSLMEGAREMIAWYRAEGLL